MSPINFTFLECKMPNLSVLRVFTDKMKVNYYLVSKGYLVPLSYYSQNTQAISVRNRISIS